MPGYIFYPLATLLLLAAAYYGGKVSRSMQGDPDDPDPNRM